MVRRASSPFDRYQIILLGEQRHVCEQLAQGRYHQATLQCGIEPCTGRAGPGLKFSF